MRRRHQIFIISASLPSIMAALKGNLKGLITKIQDTYNSILKIMDTLPTKHKRLLRASLEAGSFVVGFVPGGAIVTMVNGFITANSLHQSIREAHTAFRGVPPEKTMEQLKRVHAEAELELHKAEQIHRAEQIEEEVLQHLRIDVQALQEKSKGLVILDEQEIAELQKVSRQEVEKGLGNLKMISFESLIAVLHFEMKQMTILIKELEKNKSSVLTEKLRLALHQVLELRTLIAQRNQHLTQQAAEEAVIREEETALYTFQRASTLLQAQLLILKQHKKELESLLSEMIRQSNEYKDRTMLWWMTNNPTHKLVLQHRALEQKFLQSLTEARKKYLSS